LAPVFKRHNLRQFQKELVRETVLPFTWKDPKPRSGHFSNVFHAKLHVAHQDQYDWVRNRGSRTSFLI
jgi:hypothetical protein